MIDPFKRYQTEFCILEIYPDPIGRICACGCGSGLTGRQRKWATYECLMSALTLYGIIKGDSFIIRREVFRRDGGKCNKCGIVASKWDADHVLPVHLGGGGCDLSNFQTLCKDCHKVKSRLDSSVLALELCPIS